MKKINLKNAQFLVKKTCLFLPAAFVFLASCNKSIDKQKTNQPLQTENLVANANSVAGIKTFGVTNLVGNNDEYSSSFVDPVLTNAWGLAFGSSGIAWIAAEYGHVSTVYNSDGAQVRPAVNIPSPWSATGGSPSGVVFNGTNDFILPQPNGQAARFIFVGTDGVLSGWNGASGNNAMLIKDNSATSAYTGLAIAAKGNDNFLYAANFRTGKIDVFGKNFNWIKTPWGAFTDPNLPAGYAPFNIQNVGGWLYVLYAKTGSNGEEEKGMGLGYVDIYNTNGTFVKRFISGGQLNAPWGIAQASPSFFGSASGNQNIILVGNFGNGHINAYSSNGDFVGALWSDSKPIEIQGLWALSFAPATATSIDPGRLYFTAGPDDEADGVFGYIKKRL